MLLAQSRIRGGRRPAPRSERGSAMIAVIGVMALTAVVAMALGASALYSTGAASAARAGVQSRAAAESGLDVVAAGLSSGTLACASGVVDARTSDPSFLVRLYTSTDGGTTWTSSPTCPTSTTTRVRAVATGYAAQGGVAGQARDDEATMEGVYATSTVPSISLDKAVFGNVLLDMPGSGNVVSDSTGANSADMYSNGTISVGSANSCGNLDLAGDLLLPNAGVTLTTSCLIRGDVWANGSVNATSNAEVKGSIVSRTGSADFSNKAIRVGGAMTLAGGFTGFDSATVGGVACGPTDWSHPTIYRCPAARTAVATSSIPAIPTAAFPQLTMPTSGTQKWGSFIRTVALRNGVTDSWNGAVKSTDAAPLCQIEPTTGGGNSIGTAGIVTTGAMAIDATACATLSFASGAVPVTLGGDLTIYVNSLRVANGMSVKTVGGSYSLRIIVPYTRVSTCSTQDIVIERPLTSTSAATVLLYSPNMVYVNSSDFYGQAYGCTVRFTFGTKLHYAPVGAPAGSGGTPTPTVTLVSRRDVVG